MEQDQLFGKPGYPDPFEFNEDVAMCFDDMLMRSIPHYMEVVNLVGAYSFQYYQKGTRVYDCGCSTGLVLEKLSQSLPAHTDIIGLDTSVPMIERASVKLRPYREEQNIQLFAKDITAFPMDHASVVICNYTMQFLPVSQRRRFLNNVHQALVPGGILILSDKVSGSCPEFQESFVGLYENFKRNNGYTEKEIERKKEALQNVLIPFTSEEEESLVREVGFATIEPILRWNNFVTWVSLKH